MVWNKVTQIINTEFAKKKHIIDAIKYSSQLALNGQVDKIERLVVENDSLGDYAFHNMNQTVEQNLDAFQK